MDMYVFGGRVHEAHAALESSTSRFTDMCAGRFHEQYGQFPGEPELRSWTNSWPELTRTLMDAGLGELHIFLEYELPGSGERVDALLLGVGSGGVLVAVVIELKQWSFYAWASATRVEVAGTEYTHPCRQAAGYVRYFQHWLQEPGIEYRAVALLHAAPSKMIDDLRRAVSDSPGSCDVSLIGRDDVWPAADGDDYAETIISDDLHAPDTEQVRRFLGARHNPSRSVFNQLSTLLASKPTFVLVGRQQDAHLHVYDAVRKASPDSKHVIAVSGGPGTGKTVIAARLLADLPGGRHASHTSATTQYVTPSGTLRQQLERAAEAPETKGLFRQLDDFLGRRSAGGKVLLVDEAQRMKRDRGQLEKLVAKANVSVIFLDERQIIRPGEGVTVEEIRHEANKAGATFAHIALTSQFRCGGSQNFHRWLELLFFGHDTAQKWAGTDYDLGVTRDPAELSTWIAERTRSGKVARIAAGFCWPWSTQAGPNLPEDVLIRWVDQNGAVRTWKRPWNSPRPHRKAGEVYIPKKEFWATDRGGQDQVGCIYTGQGLEYEYGGVILGPDLVRRDGRWEARPSESNDPVMRDVSPTDYLRYATNTYWVLASRATRGCRMYSTDPETREFLEGLVTDAPTVTSF